MAHNHNSFSMFVDLIPKNLTDIPSGLSIQRCGRLIREKNRRITRKRSCNGDPLPFSWTEFIGLLVAFITETKLIQQMSRHFQSLGLLRVAKFETNRNVVDRRECVEKADCLKHEANFLLANGGLFC